MGLALLLALLIGAAAWVPTIDSGAPLVHLAPVAASAPKQSVDVHALFRSGPLLQGRYSAGATYAPPAHTVLFQYTRLGSNASYRTAASIR